MPGEAFSLGWARSARLWATKHSRRARRISGMEANSDCSSASSSPLRDPISRIELSISRKTRPPGALHHGHQAKPRGSWSGSVRPVGDSLSPCRTRYASSREGRRGLPARTRARRLRNTPAPGGPRDGDHVPQLIQKPSQRTCDSRQSIMHGFKRLDASLRGDRR